MKKIKWKRWLGTACLAVGMFLFSISAYALTTQEKINQAEQEKKETEGKLTGSQENLTDLKEEQDSLKGSLSNLNTQLNKVSDNLSELEGKIATKEKEIEETQKNLEEAKQTAENQYQAMKQRIRCMYEMGNLDMFDGLIYSKSYADMINYQTYVSAIAEYDKNMLTVYEENREAVAAKEKELEAEKEEMLDYKVQVEAEQSRVSGLVSSTSNSIAQYSNQISNTEAEIEAYEAQIKAQESNIAELKKKLAEEMALSKLSAQSAKRDISQVTFADGDRYLLANLIYCEAGGEPYEGQVAVGAVVINRLLSSVFPDTITGVIYQKRQFSPVASGRLALALAENRATARCYQAADEAMSGVSNVGDCVFFRTPIEGLSGISIGGHIFY